MDTFLSAPEDKILKQGEQGDAMFFISQGDCTVDVRSETGRDYNAIRLLVQGQHFGEMSFLYDCTRTASVMSRNYNMMARLSFHRLKEVIN